MLELSIIIVNYNSQKYLINCLQSIYQNTKDISFEVIVVDNASSDDSAAIVAREFPKSQVIKNDHNLGFIKGNNIGLRLAKGKYLLSLNNDTEIKDNALKILVDFMDSHPEAGACGAKLLNSNGTIQHQCKRGFPTPWNICTYSLGLSKLFPKSKLFGGYLMAYLDPNKINEIDAISGACFMVRKEIADRVGIMDEDYIMYGDDLDWSYRIKQAGWKIYYVPEAEIIHYGGRGGSSIHRHRNIIEFHRSMFTFYNKHYKKKYPFFITWLVYAGIGFKCVKKLLMYKLRKEKHVGSKKP